MSDNDSDFQYSDDDIDERTHEKIVEKVLSLDKAQHVKKPSRTEPSFKISEFNLVRSVTGNKGSVHLNELTQVLKQRKKHEKTTQKLQSTAKKIKTLPKPLHKPQADRIKRTVSYEKSRLKFDRWEAYVTSNRAAAHQVFPLGSSGKVKIHEHNAENNTTSFRLKSELQKKLEAINTKYEVYPQISLTQEEPPEKLTLKELKERRLELAKLRAHQKFKEAKARRQNKIKSKKYHRLLKRERVKQKLKEFEELQKTDPEQALKQLDEIEKARVEERFSLRHKSTGQWARNKQIRAKYDKESRQVLAQQLSISKELTQKTKVADSDSDDDGINKEEEMSIAAAEDDNIWTNGLKPGAEVTEFLTSYRKFWNGKNYSNNTEAEQNNDNEFKSSITEEDSYSSGNSDQEEEPTKNEIQTNKSKKLTQKIKKIKLKDIDEVFDEAEVKISTKINKTLNKLKTIDETKVKLKKGKKPKKVAKKKIDLTMKSKLKKPIIDEAMNETNEQNNANSIENILSKSKNNNHVERPDLQADILPANIKKKKSKPVNKPVTNLDNAIPDQETTFSDDDNNNDTQEIAELFLDDENLAKDFAKEKATEIEKDTPKDIDLNLPGWGSWAGAMIRPNNKRRRKRFILKMPKIVPRKDQNKGSLIINENAQSKIKTHMVSQVPFPFKTIKDFEASIRAPLGNTFVPETAFRKFIKPAVEVRAGAIIEPVEKSVIGGVNKNSK